MAESNIIVTRLGSEFVATAEGNPYKGTSQTSAHAAAIHLLERTHGPRHFLKHRLRQSSAVFSVVPAPPRTMGGFRG